MRRLLVFLSFFLSLSSSAAPAPGSVRAFAKISSSVGLVGWLDLADNFGYAVAALGDLDGDAVPDLAVGAFQDDDGGDNRGAVYILFMASNYTVKSEQKISDSEGCFSGVLRNQSWFGVSLANLGDLNGDTVTDIAVGAHGDGVPGNFTGAVFILFLNTNGTVKEYQKISDNLANFSGSLADRDRFGISVATIGDLNFDGVQDLAVGAFNVDDGALDSGAVYILFLKTNGTVLFDQMISSSHGNFTGILTQGVLFGCSITTLGDLNGDGIQDIAVGARKDDDGGQDRGALWILFLNSDGTVQSLQKISSKYGNFKGTWALYGEFGQSVAALGDLNSDGIQDIAVGAYRDDDGGADKGSVFILFLNTNGTVQHEQKISDLQGNFSDNLMVSDFFGSSVCLLNSPYGGEIPSIAVGAYGDDLAYGDDSRHGAVWILFLNSAKSTQNAPLTSSAVSLITASQSTAASTAEPLLSSTALTMFSSAAAGTSSVQSSTSSSSSSAGLTGTTITTEPLPILKPSLADSKANSIDALAIIIVLLAVACLAASLLVLLRRRQHQRENSVVSMDDHDDSKSSSSMDDQDITESCMSVHDSSDGGTELKFCGAAGTRSAVQTDCSDDDYYGSIVSLMSTPAEDPNCGSVATKRATGDAADGTDISTKASASIQNRRLENKGHDGATDRLQGVKFASGSLKAVLGQGKFGKVYLAKWEGQEIAVKQISSGIVGDLEQEINVLAQLNHPCVVRYFGLVDLSSEFGDGMMGIALEFCAHGSLDQALRKTRFPTMRLLEMSCQIARGLSYLAGRSILHRDLAARNVLLDRAFQCKLTDFGLARLGFDDNDIYQTSSSIPIRWSAPETLTDQSYSLKSDVYSLAITIAEVWSYGEMPFAYLTSNISVIVAIVNGERPHRPAGMPPSVYSELQKCWAVDVRDRPSARDFAAALEHIAEETVQEDAAAEPERCLEIDENSNNYWYLPANFADLS